MVFAWSRKRKWIILFDGNTKLEEWKFYFVHLGVPWNDSARCLWCFVADAVTLLFHATVLISPLWLWSVGQNLHGNFEHRWQDTPHVQWDLAGALTLIRVLGILAFSTAPKVVTNSSVFSIIPDSITWLRFICLRILDSCRSIYDNY